MERRPPRESPVVHSPSLDFQVWAVSSAIMATAHTHPDVEVNFVRRGRLRYLLHGRFVEIGTGEIAIFWAGMPHQTLEKNTSLDGIWLTLPLLGLLRGEYTRTLAVALLQGEVIRFPAGGRHEEDFARWRDDFSSKDARLRDIAKSEIASYFSRLSLTLKKTARGKPPRLPAEGGRIEGVLEFLAANYREAITVDDVAKAVRLHPKYLLVLFRRACRMTLWEYVVRLRLAHAQRLLLTTDRTVADIAFDAGFNSQSAFYQAFRKYVPAGTPAAFRAGLSG